jgi:hypothetical protein
LIRMVLEISDWQMEQVLLKNMIITGTDDI